MNDRLVKALRDHPVRFAQAVGFDKLTNLHNEWIRSMVLETEDYTLLGHRNSYKTTCLSFAFALIIVLMPDKTTFFIRKTDDDVKDIVEQVRKILKSDVFAYIVRELYGVDLVLTTSTSFQISTNLCHLVFGQAQLQGMGLNGSITGKHADFVFTDDIVNVKDQTSKAERDQTKRQYQELQNVKKRGGRIFNTGTIWHVEDCVNERMPNKHFWTIYDTGLISKEKEQELRGEMTAALFAANYELKIIADKDAMFKSANWLDDTRENAQLIHGGSAHIDAAYGGSDFTAYSVMHELRDGRIIAYGHIWQEHVDECIPTIKLLHAEMKAGSIAVETNGDKGYLADELEDEGFYVYSYSEHMNKYIKISTYLKKNWRRIWWLADTDPEYIRQIMSYTEHAEHDDAPDSAASLIRYLDEKPTLNTGLRGL